MNSDLLLENLIKIGDIKKNDKISLKKKDGYLKIISISKKKWYRPFIRMLNNDSRKNTCKYLNYLLIDELNDIFKQTLDRDYVNKIKEALENALIGINNLRYTYKFSYDINISLICLNLQLLCKLEYLSHIKLAYEPFIPRNL